MRQLRTTPDVRLCTFRPPYHFGSPFDGQPYVLLLHSDDPRIPVDVQAAMASQIVASGCRYVCCSGEACSTWDDAVDMAFITTDPEYQPPAERFIMTTWHEREPLSEVVWFALRNTSFDNFVAERFLIALLNSGLEREREIEAAVTGGK